MLQKLELMAMMAKTKVVNLLTDEKGEVNIVATVVLIGIAVMLALLFKGQITNLLNKMFGNISNTTDSIFTS